MRIAIVGSGAVGGYYGAMLARAGHRVTFIARGAHLRAIRERGLLVWSPLGDFTVRAPAESEIARVGPVDLVLLAVKTYDNDVVLPQLPALCGPGTIVLTLQNGVDSPVEVAQAVGEERVLAGPTYIATAMSAPGVIEQTGTHRRIVFGEVFDARRRGDRARARASPRPSRRRISRPNPSRMRASRCGRSSSTWRRMLRSADRRASRPARSGATPSCASAS